MNDEKTNKASFRDFPLNFWIVIIFEFFERGSYYGMMSFLALYMTDELGIPKSEFGIIKTVMTVILYVLPILAGAIADKTGYRRTLTVAFSLLGIGYFMTSQVTQYTYLFISLVIMSTGAGIFKPLISGTIARLTDEKNSTLGFGLFYWSINFGAFLFPLILVPLLKAIDSTYVMVASAIITGGMIIPTFLIYKDPPGIVPSKDPLSIVIKEIFSKIWIVLSNYRFILFILLYSLFWILYDQMFHTVLWYLNVFVDTRPLNEAISPILESLFGFTWYFDVEHVTVINALTIILLQLVIASIFRKTPALPTIIIGVVFGILGFAILAISRDIWVFILGLLIFSLGEMTAHPKYFSYLSNIAPVDKKATYMGFSFLYGIGMMIGPIIGAFLYTALVDNPMIAYIKSSLATMGKSSLLSGDITIKSAMDAAKTAGIEKAQILGQAQTQELWLIFCGIGVVCVVGLLLYDRFIGTAISKQSGVQNETI